MPAEQTMNNLRRWLLIFLVWLWAAGIAPAQPFLHCVFPAAGQRGVQLQGSNAAPISDAGVSTRILDAYFNPPTPALRALSAGSPLKGSATARPVSADL